MSITNSNHLNRHHLNQSSAAMSYLWTALKKHCFLKSSDSQGVANDQCNPRLQEPLVDNDASVIEITSICNTANILLVVKNVIQ